MPDYDDELFDDGFEEDEEEIELNPPDHENVAVRTLCLAAFIMRGEYERVIQTTPGVFSDHGLVTAIVQKNEAMIRELERWLVDEGLFMRLSESEKTYFSKGPGTWPERFVINSGWRSEALAAILWGLSLEAGLPPYDEMVNQKKVIEKSGLMKPLADLMVRTRLRPLDELLFQRDIAETMHWRARTAQMILTACRWESEIPVEEVIRREAEGALLRGEVSDTMEGDFVLFGRPYRELGEVEQSQAMSTAMERHFALNWLCGYSDDWDDTPTDT